MSTEYVEEADFFPIPGEHRRHGLPSDRVSDPFEGGRRGKSGAGEEERGRLQVRGRGAQRAGPADHPQEQTPQRCH